MILGQEYYLGDGLYASFDGWQIKLRAPRDDGDHWVALEDTVFAKFLVWARGLEGNHKGILEGFIANEVEKGRVE